MLQIKHIDRDSQDFPEFCRLYRSAFPLQERVHLGVYLEDRTGTLDILGFYEESTFCGFSILMTYGDLTQILYFAIEEEMRGRGYGGRALEALKQYFSSRLMADVEEPEEGSPLQAFREARIRFYKQNGFTETPVRFGWEGERYVMLVSRGSLTAEEYKAFWRQAKDDRGEHFEVTEREACPIGLKRGTVRLDSHRPEWDEVSAETIKTLRKMLGEAAVDIQAAGSTAIPAIKAKPILDIVVGVEDVQAVLEKVPELAACQIVLRKNQWPRELLFACGALEDDFITHHIHVVPYGSEEWRHYLDLRDYLNANKAAAKEYEELKERLFAQYAGDRSSYTKGKEEMIRRLLSEAARWRNGILPD